MSPIEVALLTCTLMLLGAAAGAQLRRVLPGHHLNDHAKDIVRLGTGLIATMSALVLGLLINSASNAYEAQRNEVRQIATNLILIDELLERYGPEAQPLRKLLRGSVEPLVTALWGEAGRPPSKDMPHNPDGHAARAFIAMHELAPQTDLQRSIQSQVIQTTIATQRSRLMLFERSHAAIPVPLLVTLISWLVMIFVSFSLFSPLNPTSMAALLIIALSASSGIFLILEMGQPFHGLLQISSRALSTALAPLAS